MTHIRSLLFIIYSLSFSYAVAQVDSLRIKLDSLLRDPLFETTQVGMMVYDLNADSVLFQYQARQLMRPASTMKLVTAITALDRLGGSYEYQTRIFYTGTIADSTLTGNLYCVGGFDPSLTTDDVAVIAESIRQAGITRIVGNIIGDKQMKEVLDYGEGWCWDDDNPMLIPLSIGRKDIFLTTLRKELERQGVNVADVRLGGDGVMPSGARHLSTYRHSIDVILNRMLKESDNFYAESMFYQTAASSGHRPAKASDARTLTKQLIKRLGLGDNPYRIADGSGLSLYNYISPELLVRLLRYAYSKTELIEHLLPALPIAGVDGTLKKRMTEGNACGNVLAKTGTLSGISSLAGYLTTADGRQLCFAIINQGVMRNKDGKDFQDRVCTALCE
jgi:D-alanyl-D-alanine carboxypeptidase/D-alanyl-D-alanine-endopeptidase (penicillin-binding protein 4)